ARADIRRADALHGIAADMQAIDPAAGRLVVDAERRAAGARAGADQQVWVGLVVDTTRAAGEAVGKVRAADGGIALQRLRTAESAGPTMPGRQICRRLEHSRERAVRRFAGI